jgi:hypothetical protein
MKLIALLLILTFLATPPLWAEPGDSLSPPPTPLGSTVNWARLVTPNEWDRHRNNDPMLVNFINTRTSLNLEPTCKSAHPDDLRELCAYPLIFANWINELKDPTQLANVREYLARGGFLFVDTCVNRDFVPDPDVWLRDTRKCLEKIAPGHELRPLPNDHPIYTGFFTLKHRPPHAYQDGIVDPRWAKHPTYGVFVQDRMVAIISLNGIQCATGETPLEVRQDRMKLVVNIYVYAMTH